jgi:hypothetical protein
LPVNPLQAIAIVAIGAELALGSCGSPPATTGADGSAERPVDASPDEAGDASADGPVIAEYDLGADFSIVDNPNGPWRYGHTRDAALAASRFDLDAFSVDSTPVQFWHPSDALYYPYIAHNPASSTVTDPTDSWAVRSHEVAMEASQDGQYSVVQFVAPRDGSYEIQADFTGIHSRLSSTDVHVLYGDTAAFDAQIDGYGGDPVLHAVEGQNPRASYHQQRTLATGDIVSFAVGVGQNGTYVNDTTGLFVHIAARE